MTRYRPNPPPSRDGLSPSCVVVPQGQPQRALEFVCKRFAFIDEADWLARFASADVIDAHGQIVHADTLLQPGQRLYYYRRVHHEPPVPFEEHIVWRDDNLLVVDKPHFLPVIPSGKYVRETLLVRLKHKLGLDTLSPIHRIDRDTAGLVLFSVNPATRNAYQALFRERQVHKIYHAVANWDPSLAWPVVRESRIGASAHFMQQQEIPGAPNARTTIRPLQVRAHQALYELQPLTGQRHQLRVHMAALGLPLLHDGIYPTLQPEGSCDYSRPLQLLAKAIAFTDPVSAAHRKFESARSLWAPLQPDAAQASPC